MSYRRYKKFSNKNPTGTHKPPFALFNPHTLESPIMRNENIVITSIDPGIVNCGIYVDCYNTNTKIHTSLFLGRLEFNKEDNHYIEAINKLDKLEKENEYFSSSHYIVIESQMAISYDNTRMGQHLISYFCTKFKDIGNRPHIIEFNSQSKTRLLGCPKGTTKYKYKKWCRDKAISLLKERDNDDHEKKFISCLSSNSKTDDMGDAICQTYAWIMTMEGQSLEIHLPVKKF